MTLRIVDGDAHLLEGAEFITELMEAHPDKVRFQSTGGISGATIEGKRFPNSTGNGSTPRLARNKAAEKSRFSWGRIMERMRNTAPAARK